MQKSLQKLRNVVKIVEDECVIIEPAELNKEVEEYVISKINTLFGDYENNMKLLFE